MGCRTPHSLAPGTSLCVPVCHCVSGHLPPLPLPSPDTLAPVALTEWTTITCFC